jgi:hypothetical protein
MPLPTFLIIGAAKSGTTSLHEYLKQHPQIFMSRTKETNFFAYPNTGGDWAGDVPTPDRFMIRTIAEYQALFADATSAKAVGEASPLYLESPSAALRIRDCIPEVRLIACLRQPADRAFSGYLMRVRSGHERRRAEEALTPESHYVRVGFYYDQLKRYFDVFSRDQIRVYLFEDLKERAPSLLHALQSFIGVDPSFVPNLGVKHNQGAFPKSRLLASLLSGRALPAPVRVRMPSAPRTLVRRLRALNERSLPVFPRLLRLELTRRYRADIKRLEDLVRQDLSSWLENTE